MFNESEHRPSDPESALPSSPETEPDWSSLDLDQKLTWLEKKYPKAGIFQPRGNNPSRARELFDNGDLTPENLESWHQHLVDKFGLR